MMRTGEIYKWVTQKATGHNQRTKYHVFISEDSVYQNVFLFINSENYYQDFEILQSDYTFLTKPSSFISCSDVVCYDHNELEHVPQKEQLGKLKKECMEKLAQHIASSHVMETRFINIICRALRFALEEKN